MATVHEKISNDGNELTSTTAAAGHADKITVWTRSGGKKVPNDLFAGEWTQDSEQDPLAEGLVLKIEADGSGGSVSWVTSAIPPDLTGSHMI